MKNAMSTDVSCLVFKCFASPQDIKCWFRHYEFCLPSAVSVQISCPTQQVACVNGDDNFQMNYKNRSLPLSDYLRGTILPAATKYCDDLIQIQMLQETT